MRRSIALVLLAMGSSGCRAELRTSSPATESRRWSTDTDQAWNELGRHLTGPRRWKATTAESRTITTSYRLVSNGSALVETFTSASGKETLSVYHRDGRSLMLTHYCAQGNQARLKATEATREKVVFTHLDATNVSGDQGVMHRLAIVFRTDTPDAFDQESMYRDARGEEETTTLHFRRED